MSDFKREDRYIVLKKKDLDALYLKGILQNYEVELLNTISATLPRRYYVVVESDWPEYEKVWQMIEDRMNAK